MVILQTKRDRGFIELLCRGNKMQGQIVAKPKGAFVVTVVD